MQKKTLVLLNILLGIVILGVFVFFRTDQWRKFEAKRYLKSYGWVHYGAESRSKNLSDEYLNQEGVIPKIEASKKVGLNPKRYVGKTITVFTFFLNKPGDKECLMAEVWFYKNRIILSLIYLPVNKIRIKYWPINTPYNNIKRYILTEKRKQQKEGY